MHSALIGVAFLLAPSPQHTTTFINQYISNHWQEAKITPSLKCTDHEFIRRASLDLIGRIPTVGEIDVYMKDAAADRRRLLIDRLLDHEEYARHWANIWSGILLGAKAAPHEPFHGWLHAHFCNNCSHKELAENLLLAKGSTRDNPAVHFFVTHRGEKLPEADWAKLGQYDMGLITDKVVRAFRGRRLECAQCHCNTLDDDLVQAHFHGVNAFFRQVEFKRKRSVNEINDNPKLNANGLIGYDQLNGITFFIDPTFLDGKKIPKTFKGTRREFFTECLVGHPDFARSPGQSHMDVFTWP